MTHPVRSAVRAGLLLGALLAPVVPVPAQEQQSTTAPEGATSEPEERTAPSTPAPPPDPEVQVLFGTNWFADESNPNSAKFEEYREVPNGFVIEDFTFVWAPKPRRFFELKARDVSQLDQRVSLSFGRIDKWRAELRNRENPRRWTDSARTLFADVGDGFFTLPDAFQSAVLAASGTNVDTTPADNVWDAGTKGNVVQNAVNQGAVSVFVGSQRRTVGAGVQFTPSRHWTFTADADRERRSGTTPQNLGFYFSFAPAEVAAPMDFRTDWVTGSAEYRNGRFNAGAQVGLSTFNTGYDTLTWDNQMILADTPINANQANPGHGRLALGTDNDSYRVALYGGVNLPGRTRIDASASRITTTQDDPFLPMTINTQLTAAPLPAESFDGKHETTTAQIRVSSRPLRSFRWNAWVRSFDLHNASPSLAFTDYVQTDYQFPLCGNVNVCGAITNRIGRRSLPYGYQKNNAGALAGWSPVHWFDGSVSLERENIKRDFSAVEDSDEDIGKITLDFYLGDRLSLRTAFKHQERRSDEYDAHYLEESFTIGEAVEAPVNEGMRRFYWTDRDRDAVNLMLDWTPAPAWSLYAEATYQNDKYMDPNTGKKVGDSFTVNEDRNFDTVPEVYDILIAGRDKDKSKTVAVGFSYNPKPRFNLFAEYTWETWEYGLESRYRNVTGVAGAQVGTDDPLDNWGSDTTDDYTMANLGIVWGLTKDMRWRLDVDASRSEGTGDIRTHFTPLGASSGNTTLTRFPQLKTTLTIATATLTHLVNKNLDYRLRYWYESWDEMNFASDFNQPYMGAPNQDPSMAQAIFLGLDFQDYTNHILGFFLHYTY